MAAKQSAEMRKALELVRRGIPVAIAAEKSGVRRTSVYAKLKKDRDAAENKNNSK